MNRSYFIVFAHVNGLWRARARFQTKAEALGKAMELTLLGHGVSVDYSPRHGGNLVPVMDYRFAVEDRAPEEA